MIIESVVYTDCWRYQNNVQLPVFCSSSLHSSGNRFKWYVLQHKLKLSFIFRLIFSLHIVKSKQIYSHLRLFISMQHHRQIVTSFVVHEHVLNVSVCRWPRTLAGITAYLPCKRQVSGAGIYSGSSAEDRRAWRRCGRSGQWADDDYSRCEYMKDVTRVLYIINQVEKCNFASSKAVEPCSILCLILMHILF